MTAARPDGLVVRPSCGRSWFVLEHDSFPERIAPVIAVIWEVKAQTLPCVGITRIRKTYDMHMTRSVESVRFIPPGMVLSEYGVLDRRC